LLARQLDQTECGREDASRWIEMDRSKGREGKGRERKGKETAVSISAMYDLGRK